MVDSKPDLTWMAAIEEEPDWDTLTAAQHVERAQALMRRLAHVQRVEGRGLVRSITPIEATLATMHLQVAAIKSCKADAHD
jgi:hypothetical protein